MHGIRAGDPLQLGVTGFEEGTHYNYTMGGHSLVLSVKDPSPSEIAAVKVGDAVFGLTTREEAIFLICRFGRLPWRIAHYNWWINPLLARPDASSDARVIRDITLATVLVNASNGIVCALRSVRLSPEFSFLLLSAVEAQMKPRFDPWRYLDVVKEALDEHPTGNTLLREASCMCTCTVRHSPPLHGGADLVAQSVH